MELLRNDKTEEEVCLSAGEGTYLYLLGTAISSFITNSSSRLKIRVGNQRAIIEDVLSGNAHVGITPLDVQDQDLVSRSYTRVGQVLVMKADHPLASKSRVTLNSLQGEALIVPPENAPHRILINRLLMDLQINWCVSVEVTGWELMLKFVKQGLGLATVNEYCFIPPGLVAKPLREFPSIQFHLIKRRHATNRPTVSELEKTLLQFKDAWRNDGK